MARIVVVGDTHVTTWEAIPAVLRDLMRGADIAVHCGDWVGIQAVEGFLRELPHGIAVHGNSDPVEVRRALPYRQIFEVDGVRIGVTHPAWGREEPPPHMLLPDFPEEQTGKLDILCYGHIHVPMNEVHQGVHFVNGGQGYASFMVPGTYALIETAPGGKFHVSIEEFAPAR
ncbi:MAG: metallophosphoesterase family protein [Chloroflexi bacterium]|nr:metallophosphoesterase family protein [Chloroflexota bacterium]MDA1240952.1 metallophosphoesterase family protein [Chloroflexota bacterium]